MHLVRGSNASSAWMSAARYLADQPSYQAWDLAVEIDEPLIEEDAVRAGLDQRLRESGKQDLQTVANTIFPATMWATSRNRETFYRRYEQILPSLRRFPKNRHGLYFERLIQWPPGQGAAGCNQLEATIVRLAHQLTLPGPLRFVYDLLTFSPVNDPQPIGFPCLSYVNVKLQDKRLLMLAHYRNHFFVERAYGNYLGLGRLQAFIAASVGLKPGPLTCVSAHAELDDHRRPFLSWLRDEAFDP